MHELDIDEDLPKWRGLIGRAILAFGGIEYTTLEVLWRLSNDDNFPIVSKLALPDRLNLACRILRQKPSGPRVRLAELLDEAGRRVRLRNLIAHNTVLIDFFECVESGEIRMIPSLRRVTADAPSLTLKDLESLVHEVEDLVSEMIAPKVEIWKEGPSKGPPRPHK